MPDLKYRYLAEAVPFGLCLTKGLARIFEVLAYGLRAGFVCVDGTMTGSVDEVVCEGGNCTASTADDICESGLVKAWCETSSHVKVERLDTSVCSGFGGPWV